jgi:hypothetical protein
MKLAKTAVFIATVTLIFTSLGAAEDGTTNASQIAPAHDPRPRTMRVWPVHPSTETNAVVSLPVDGTNRVIPVEVTATRGEIKRSSGRREWTVEMIQYRVESKDEIPYTWFCWDGRGSHAHDFKLFVSTNGATYACYTSDGGVNLFLIEGSVDSQSARDLYLSTGRGPGEIQRLHTGFLMDSVGYEPFHDMNALFWAIFVDDVSEVDGELRVTLHGVKPETQFTFALRDEQWEWISTTNDPTKAIDEEVENPPRKLVPVLGDLPFLRRFSEGTNARSAPTSQIE